MPSSPSQALAPLLLPRDGCAGKPLVTGVRWVQWHGESPGRATVIAAAKLRRTHPALLSQLRFKQLRGEAFVLARCSSSACQCVALMRETEYERRRITVRTDERDGEGGHSRPSKLAPLCSHLARWKSGRPVRNGYFCCCSQFKQFPVPTSPGEVQGGSCLPWPRHSHVASPLGDLHASPLRSGSQHGAEVALPAQVGHRTPSHLMFDPPILCASPCYRHFPLSCLVSCVSQCSRSGGR